MKPLVVYLAYEPFGKEYLKNFIKFYKKFDSGFGHDLLICFKQFEKKNRDEWKKVLINKSVDFIEFNDDFEKNDFDIGSYFRIAEKYPNRFILFLNTYTRPNTNDWLKIFTQHYVKKSIIGATASYASLSSQFLNFYYPRHTKFQQLRWGLKHLINVKLFPNPHIRTTGFFMKASDLLSFKFDRSKFVKKIETNYFEGGRNGLSNVLLKNGFKLLLVNSDNKVFKVKDWVKSQTFCIDNQEKLIFVDNRTKEYSNSDKKTREKMSKFTWGKI